MQCVAAAKQCGLNFLPEMRPSVALDAFLAGAEGLVLLGDCSDGAAPVAEALRGAGGSEISPLIGPERGLTAAERQLAIAAGARPVRLGATTLRTETAAVALLAVVTAALD